MSKIKCETYCSIDKLIYSIWLVIVDYQQKVVYILTAGQGINRDQTCFNRRWKIFRNCFFLECRCRYSWSLNSSSEIILEFNNTYPFPVDCTLFYNLN